jgi:cellulose biosynthesis protein BcsQ
MRTHQVFTHSETETNVDMPILHFIGAKGGVGTTTAVALIAASLIADGQEIMVVDTTATGDLAALDPTNLLRVTDTLPDSETDLDRYVVLVDHLPLNFSVLHRSPAVDDGLTVLVTTNSSLAVRRALNSGRNFDAVLLIRDPNCFLEPTDLIAMFSSPLILTPHYARISVLSDGGALVSNPDRRIQRFGYATAIAELILSNQIRSG